MSLPAVAVRAAVPAVRAVAPAARTAATRIGAWMSTASYSQLKAFKDFIKRHPTLSSVVGSLGMDEIVDRAMSGDESSIQALNDAAAHVGLSGDASSGSESTGLLDRAQKAIGSVFSDSQTEAITDAEAEKTQQMRDLARFIRGEVSSNPEFVLRYHAMMNEFLSMDIESVENLVRAY